MSMTVNQTGGHPLSFDVDDRGSFDLSLPEVVHKVRGDEREDLPVLDFESVAFGFGSFLRDQNRKRALNDRGGEEEEERDAKMISSKSKKFRTTREELSFARTLGSQMMASGGGRLKFR